MYAEKIALTTDLDIVRLLDLSSHHDDVDRAAGVKRVGDSLASYLESRRSLSEPRRAFSADEFWSALLLKEARELLTVEAET